MVRRIAIDVTTADYSNRADRLFRAALPIGLVAFIAFQLTISEHFLLYRVPMAPPRSLSANTSLSVAIVSLKRGGKFESDPVAMCAHKRLEQYARLHNYTLYDESDYPDESVLQPYHPWMIELKKMRFDKLRFLLWISGRTSADWIFWMDADAFLADFTVKVQDRIAWFEAMHRGNIELSFVIGSDHHAINSGVFLLRNNENGRRMLQLFYDEHVEPTMTWADQLAIINVLERDDRSRNSALILPGPKTYLLQSSTGFIWNLNQWRRTDYILHCPHISDEDKSFVERYFCAG
jgi:hypothetical protein